MSIGFLNNFMHFAYTTTDSERAIALDLEMNIHDSVNVDDALLQKEDFADLLRSSIDEAINTDDIVVTNNLITDPEDAPKTNVHLHELRMVVALSLQGYGAIYLDKRIRQGIYPRDLVERLHDFARYLIENNKTDLTTTEFDSLFEDVSTA